MKLELKHLVGYLPYGLKVQSTTGHITSISIEFDECDFCVKEVLAGIAKPILHPLSDLTKFCEDLGFVPIENLKERDSNIEFLGWYKSTFAFRLDEKEIGYMAMPYYIIQQLQEWHFDIHNLIENNLAIDINTL